MREHVDCARRITQPERLQEILGEGYGFREGEAEVRVWRKGAAPGEKLTEEDVRRLDSLKEVLLVGVTIKLVADPALWKGDAQVVIAESAKGAA